MNIVLIGYRCSGKTAVGRVLADELSALACGRNSAVITKSPASILFARLLLCFIFLLLISFHPEMALFRNFYVNLLDCLCDVPYARLRTIP